jgi:hypothetical protein
MFGHGGAPGLTASGRTPASGSMKDRSPRPKGSAKRERHPALSPSQSMLSELASASGSGDVGPRTRKACKGLRFPSRSNPRR